MAEGHKLPRGSEGGMAPPNVLHFETQFCDNVTDSGRNCCKAGNL